MKTQVWSWLKWKVCLSQRLYPTNLQNTQVRAILFVLHTPFLPLTYLHLSADCLEFVRERKCINHKNEYENKMQLCLVKNLAQFMVLTHMLDKTLLSKRNIFLAQW